MKDYINVLVNRMGLNLRILNSKKIEVIPRFVPQTVMFRGQMRLNMKKIKIIVMIEMSAKP